MKYFMTGATGFIGGHMARLLVRDGHQVVALVRDPAKAKDLAKDVLGLAGVTLHPGDIVDRESMRAGMTGVDGVFHVAGWYKVGARDKGAAERINIEGTRNVLSLMQELGVSRGVYTSTLAVFSDTGGRLVDEGYRFDGPFLSEYDRTKWEAHYHVAEPMIRQGLPLVIVQPGLVYGPGDQSPAQQALDQYLQGKLPMSPKITAFCWGHVEDTARGHLLAMERGRAGESYIIAGPRHSFIEALALAERITGIPAPRMHPGPRLVKAMAAMMEGVGKLVPLPDRYSGEALRAIAGVTYIGSNQKARRELGFSPRALEQGLSETLQHAMERLGIQPRRKPPAA